MATQKKLAQTAQNPESATNYTDKLCVSSHRYAVHRSPPENLTVRESAAIAKALTILETKCLRTGKVFCDSLDTANYLRLRFAGLHHEEMHVLLLDTQHRLIEAICVAVGTIDQATVYIREIAAAALRVHADAIIVAHNHPGGSATPSAADISLHHRIESSLRLLNIRLLDSFVVTARSTTNIAACIAEMEEKERNARLREAEARRAERLARKEAKTKRDSGQERA